ncbi:MAG: fibronectin type III domain-containing protein [Terriglobia bacterium]
MAAWKSTSKRCLWVFLFARLCASSLLAADIQLSWNPNTESDLAGYKVYYGSSPRRYTHLAGVADRPNFIVSGLVAGTYFFAVTAYDFSGNEGGFSNEVSLTVSDQTWILPSSAHFPGYGGAFYITDLTIANPGNSDSTVTLKFLGNNVDGSSGPEKTYSILSKQSVTFDDLLSSVFGVASGWGAVQIKSASPDLAILSQTYTAGRGGTFGQSVPALRTANRIAAGKLAAISGIREDPAFRTNLILANATNGSLGVDVSLISENGVLLGYHRYNLFPLGMTQVRVVPSLGVSGEVRGAYLLLSTSTADGDFAAYASAIDNLTNDPRTLLSAIIEGDGIPSTWILPSAAHAGGIAGAFFTTDVAISNVGNSLAQSSLKFLGNNRDGRTGTEVGIQLGGGKAITYYDVLSSVFGLNSNNDFGAVLLKSSSSAFSIVTQTSTPAEGGGTFGLSVPAISASQLIGSGVSRSIPGIREDTSFRTNLVLCNGAEIPIDIDVAIISDSGSELARGSFSLYPLGMTQTRVVLDLGLNGNLRHARLELSTPTPGGAFTAYATVIDNVTNDPRTLLPW